MALDLHSNCHPEGIHSYLTKKLKLDEEVLETVSLKA